MWQKDKKQTYNNDCADQFINLLFIIYFEARVYYEKY